MLEKKNPYHYAKGKDIIGENVTIPNKLRGIVSKQVYLSKNNLYYIYFEHDKRPDNGEEILFFLNFFKKLNVKIISTDFEDYSKNKSLLEYLDNPKIKKDEIVYFIDLGYCIIHADKRQMFHYLVNSKEKREKSDIKFFIEADKEVQTIINQKEKKQTYTLNTQNKPEYTEGIIGLKVNKTSYSGKGINVGILDTGLSLHDDFKQRNITRHSIISNDPNDDNGHGTHCTGIAYGSKIEGKVQYGVAYESNIFACKVLDKDRRGNKTDIENGILWALAHNCKVVNISIEIPNSEGQLFDLSLTKHIHNARKKIAL